MADIGGRMFDFIQRAATAISFLVGLFGGFIIAVIAAGFVYGAFSLLVLHKIQDTKREIMHKMQ